MSQDPVDDVLMLAAMPDLVAQFPDIRLTVVGDGPLRPALEAQCAQLELSDTVTFVGAVPNEDVPGYVQRAAVAIIPSVVAGTGDQEGAPVAIMETLACACPVVVSDYPGARDIIDDGENGLLVPMRDSAAITAKVSTLLNDNALRERLGAAGREKVVRVFDWRVIAARFVEVFQQSR